MERVNVSLKNDEDTLSCNECVLVHISSSGIMENVTSAPVVQQVVPIIGENNEVNFTVTTFSVVEVGTLFALMIILFKLFLSQLADR